VTPADCALFGGIVGADLQLLESLLLRRTYYRGQTIIASGQASDERFVITEGNAMVTIPTLDGIARLRAFSAGMTFGELAFLDRLPRSANVTALDTVECLVLTREAFALLEHDAPTVKICLLENLALGMTEMLRQANRELAVLK